MDILSQSQPVHHGVHRLVHMPSASLHPDVIKMDPEHDADG